MLLDASGESDEDATGKGCPFCAIVGDEAPADIVLDDPAGVAFLDRRPLLTGHLLVTPRAHVETLADLPLDAVGPFFALVQRIAANIPEVLGVDGTFIAINNRVSQSVPHLHVHIVPRRHGDRLFSRNLAWTRHPYRNDAERQAIAAAIRERLAGQERPGT
jgi:histidine triad (HIT) family protein